MGVFESRQRNAICSAVDMGASNKFNLEILEARILLSADGLTPAPLAPLASPEQRVALDERADSPAAPAASQDLAYNPMSSISDIFGGAKDLSTPDPPRKLDPPNVAEKNAETQAPVSQNASENGSIIPVRDAGEAAAAEVASPQNLNPAAEQLIETLRGANGPPDGPAPPGSNSQSNPASNQPVANRIFSPGHSPGLMTINGPEIWSGGEEYIWEVNDADAVEGMDPGWDLIDIRATAADPGTLTINATSASPFTLRIRSLNGAVLGNAADFNNANAYAWRIVRTANGITGFDRSKITLVTAEFSNAAPSGGFVVDISPDNRDLVVRYLPNLPGAYFQIAGTPTWTSQGPTQIQNGATVGLNNNPTTGAIHSLAVHPSNPDIVFVGTVNGGVWRSTNATAVNPTWTALTDNFPSLSSGAIAISPFDRTGAAVVAGTGVADLVVYFGTGSFTNSIFGGAGYGAAGVFVSTDGGTNWSRTGISPGSENVAPFRVTSIVPSLTSANTVYVGTLDATATTGGVFKSTNRGALWTRLSGSGSLPIGSVTDIVRDPADGNQLFVAISGTDTLPANKGIYRTINDGVAWAPVHAAIRFGQDFNNIDDDVNGTVDDGEGLRSAIRIRLAISPSGTHPLYAAFSDLDGHLAAVFRSSDSGATWAPLGTAPPSHLGGQGFNNLALVADPVDPNVVYVGGDRPPQLYRGDAATAGLVRFGVVSTDVNFPAAMKTPDITVNVRSDSPGLTVIESGTGTEVTEGGAVDTYTIALRTAPTDNVFVYLLPTGQVETVDAGGAAVNRLTFTTVNWNAPQTVRVRATDDATSEPFTQSVSVNYFIVSADQAYDRLDPAGVAVTVHDNESLPGLTIVESDGLTLVAEGGGADTYTVVLDTMPANDIQVILIGLPELTVVDNANPLNDFLRFTPANWNVPQTVRVTATVPDGPQAVVHTDTILHIISAPVGVADDPVYSLLANLPEVSVRIIDQNSPGITVIPTGTGTEVSEGAGSDTFWVVLNRPPTANVRLNLTANVQISAVDNVTPANTFVEFTAANWFVPQRVRITATPDGTEQDTWTPITRTGAGGTQPHPDSRNMVFDSAGNILEVDDGGIYRLRNPSNATTRRWESMNGDLAVTETANSVAYDPVTNTLLAGTQDNGVINQSTSGSMQWLDVSGGDGNYVAVDGSGADSIRYEMSNNWRFFWRRTYTLAGVEVEPAQRRVENVLNNGGRIEIWSTNHGLVDGNTVEVHGVRGVPFADSFSWTVTRVNANRFTLDGSTFSGAYLSGGTWTQTHPITAATGLDPMGAPLPLDVTSAGHGLSNGDRIWITGMQGNTAANDNPATEFIETYTVTLDPADPANRFRVDGVMGNGNYVAGGFWMRSTNVLLRSGPGQLIFSGLDNAFNFGDASIKVDQQFIGGGDFEYIPLAVNAVRPDRIALGRIGVYESIDGSRGDNITIVGDPTTESDIVTALAYGGRRGGVDAPDVLYVARGGKITVRQAGGAFVSQDAALAADSLVGAGRIIDIAIDPENWMIAAAVDAGHVWLTIDGGARWMDITGDLSGRGRLHSVDVQALEDQLVILVGTDDGVQRAIQRNLSIHVAAGFIIPPAWTQFGNGLPRVPVTDIDYDAGDNILVAATLGRGTWSMTNARVRMFDDATLFIEGSGSSEQFRLRLTPDNGVTPRQLEVLINGTSILTVPLDAIRRISVHGGDGNDTLIIDSNNGEVILPDGIVFHGDDDPLDVLRFEGLAASGLRPGLLPGDSIQTVGRQVVVTHDVESIQSAVLPADALDVLNEELDTFAMWTRHLDSSALLGQSLGGLGTSLGAAGNGSNPAHLQARADPHIRERTAVALAFPETFSSVASALLVRFFETGRGAFDLDEIGTTITTTTALRDKLQALDPSGTVTVTTIGSDTRVAVNLQKTLDGIAALDLDLLGGSLRLTGSLEIEVTVRLNAAFGVDANGFYFETNATTAELVISDIEVNGEVEGSGVFAFLGVTLSNATLTLGSAVKVSVDLIEPPDALGYPADNKIRILDLVNDPTSIAAVSIADDPSATDVTLTGTFAISALKPGGESLFNLGAINLSFAWDDIRQPSKFRIETMGNSLADILVRFLNLDEGDFLAEVRRLLDLLVQLRNTEQLDVELPFGDGFKLSDAFDFSAAFVNNVYHDLVDISLAGSTRVSSGSITQGQLSSDLTFQLVINDVSSNLITLSAASTTTGGDANSTLADLALDLNEALAAEGLATTVLVDVFRGNIRFRLLDGTSLKVTAAIPISPLFTQLGFSNNQGAIEAPKFPTLQTLLAKLEELLDPDEGGPLKFNLGPRYDQANRRLSFDLQFGYSFTKSTSFEYDTDINLGSLANFEASGDLSVTGSLTAAFTLGLDFNAQRAPRLLGSFVLPPPASGRLNNNSSFIVNVNDGQRFTVNLNAAATAGFTQLSQLIAYMNGQLSGTFTHTTGSRPLNQVIRFVQATTLDSSGNPLPSVGIRLEAINEDRDADGTRDTVNEDLNGNGRLDDGEDVNNDGRLDVNEDAIANGGDGDGQLDTFLNIVNSLTLEATDLANPIFTEIGFVSGDMARSTIKGVFLEDATFGGTLTVSASNLAASARFAILGIETSGGSAVGTASVNFALTNPRGGTRIDLDDLLLDLGHIRSYVGLNPTFHASLDIQLKNISVSPNILNSFFTGTPAQRMIRFFIPDFRDVHYNANPYNESDSTANKGLFITYPNLGPLPSFNCLSWTDLVITLDSLTDQLDDFKEFSFLKKPLPLINMSISQVIDFAADLAETVQGLLAGDGETLDELEAMVEDLLNIPDSNLDFSVEHTALEQVTTGAAATAAVYRFNPRGANNALRFTSPTNGSAYNGVTINFVDNGSLAAGVDQATVEDYDAANKVVTIRYNATYTRAETIRAAIFAKNAANAAAMPFQASLDTADAGNDGMGMVHQTALKAALNYQLSYADSLPFQFSLSDLVDLLPSDSPVRTLLGGVTDLIQVSGSGDLNVTASANLRLEFGLDISDPCNWAPFLYDTNYNGPDTGTGITLAAAIYGTNLTFSAGIGALTINVKNGTATLDSDGLADSPGGDDDAAFTVDLKDSNGDGRHYIRSSETFFDSNNIGIDLTAGASAVLPLYALSSIPLGSSSDGNGDGYPDNDLVVIIPSLKRLLFPESTDSSLPFETTVTMPGANNDLKFASPSAGQTVKFIETSGTATATLNGSTLEVRVRPAITTAAQVVALSMPTGWTATLSAATEQSGTNNGSGRVYSTVTIITPDLAGLFDDFNVCDVITNAPLLLDGLDALLATIEDALSNKVLNRNLPLVGAKLMEAADFIGDFRNGFLAELRTKLADAGDPIGLVKEAIFNALGEPGLDLIVKSDLSPIDSFDDVEVECTGNAITFKIRLKKSLALVDTTDNPIDFDIGIPGLGLKVAGNVKVEVGFDLKLYFGISATDGFYFDTSDAEELRIEFKVTIPGLNATGELFFLQLDVGDESDGQDAQGNPRDPSMFSGFFSVNLKDPVGSGNKLTFADMGSSGFDLDDFVAAELGAEAEVNLDFAISFDGDARFPRLLGEFDLDWEWTLGGGEDGDLEFGFHNIQIDIGQFISKFIQPVLEEVQKVTEPFQPVVDILTTPIPIISDLAGEPITMLDLAEFFGYIEPSTRDFIEALATIIELVNDTSFSTEGSILIPLGSFNLQRDSVGNVERKAGDPNSSTSALSDGTSDAGTKNFLGKLEELGFTFPFLDIGELFKLFRGEAITLVEYDMPALDFSFRWEQSIPLYPPLYLVFGGEVGARIDLAFGYDTTGLQKFFSSEEKNVADIFDGFFVKDLDENGNEVAEVVLSGGIFAGAELNVGIAEAGVTGGLFVEIGFDLNDPDDDGKVRVSEIIANAKEDIRCIFDIHGELYVELTAYLTIHLLIVDLEFEWDFARITLLEFDIVCPTPKLADYVDSSGNELATADSNGILRLNMGPAAGEREVGDTSDGNEKFIVTNIAGSPSDPAGETVEVNSNGIKQTYYGVKKIRADGGQGNDTIDLRAAKSPSDSTGFVRGGAGNDTIYASKSGGVYHGDSGDDVIIGRLSEDDFLGVGDTIYGDSGADTLTGNEGNDTIYGGDGTNTGTDGADTIYGNAGNDTLEGDGGNDRIFGGIGTDTIRGDDGADTLKGEDDNDLIEGGGGDDSIEGGRGDDHIIGGPDDDFIDAGSGNDIVLGDDGTISIPAAFAATIFPVQVTGISGSGNDTLAGGSGDDALFGADGNDKLFGGTLLTSGQVQVTESDGQDFIDAGDGADLIFADDAHGGEATTFPGSNVLGSAWFDLADALGARNDLRDIGENGLANVTVKLYKSDGTLAGTTKTDANGEFMFVGLEGGDYYVEFLTPSGLALVAKDDPDGVDTTDSDAGDSDSDGDAQTAVFHLDSGQTNETVAAGYYGTSTLISIDNPSIEEGDAGLTNLAFTVTLSNPSSQVVTVCYESVPGVGPDGASRILDYSSVSWTLVFQPGETAKTVLVPIVGDVTDEGAAETFTVTLGDPYGGQVDPLHDIGTGTIIDDDEAPVVNVANSLQIDPTPLDDAGPPETAPLRFTVTLSNPSKYAITLDYRTTQVVNADGTLAFDAAVAGVDYENTYELFQPAPGTLTFLPGQTERIVSINTLSDPLDEYDEQMTLTLTLAAITPTDRATLGDVTAMGRIADDDALPFVRILPITQSVTEGHAGNKAVNLTIELRNSANIPFPSGRPVTVSWNTARGSALIFDAAGDPADAVYTFQTVTFAPGDTSKPITVEIIGDTRSESGEFFYVNLLNADNGQIDVTNTVAADPAGQNHNRAAVNIIDDESGDPGPWYVEFSQANYTVLEGQAIEITVVRAAGSSQPLGVYWTIGGTATPGAALDGDPGPVDYIGIWENDTLGPRGFVSFAANETIKTFLIQTDTDTLPEGNETVVLHLANPTGGAVRSVAKTAILTIQDDDPLPVITISNSTDIFDPDAHVGGVTEGAGLVELHFTVTVNGRSDLSVKVDWDAVNGTAIAPGDYVPEGITLDFGSVNGIETQIVTITVNNDAISEVTETIKAQLSNAQNGTITDFEGFGYVFDNDVVTATGRVFMDFNGNGFFDEGIDYGLSGVDVTVAQTGGTQTDTDATNPSGEYSVSVLLGESSIEVDETATPAGSTVSTGGNPITFTFSDTVLEARDIGFTVAPTDDVPVESTGNGGSANNDTAYGGPGNDILNGGGGDDWLVGGHWLGPGCACDGLAYNANLLQQAEAAGGRPYIDPASLPTPGSIGDTVFLDSNGNGVRDFTLGPGPGGGVILIPSEAGISGIQVNLFDSEWTLIATTYTDNLGRYRFEKLTPCGYYVQFLPPAGYTFTTKDAGLNASDTLDSDASVTTGLTELITIDPGETELSIDAGLQQVTAAGLGPWSVQFSHVIYSVRETDGFATITVTRTPNSVQAIGVYFTQAGTATQGNDYRGYFENGATSASPRGIFRFGVGEEEKTFVVPVFVDATDENPETVFLHLLNPTGGLVKGNLPDSVLLIFDAPCPDDDTIFGSEGNDVMLGDFGFFTNAGAPELRGGMGSDKLYGEDGEDDLFGEGGDDLLEGGADNDALDGGSENDTYPFDGDKNLGSDTIAEVASPFGGNDTVDFSATAGWSINFDLGSSAAQTVTPLLAVTLPSGNVIENVIGGSRGDTLKGNALDNRIEGGAGDDSLEGLGGDDELIGSDGSDTYLFDADNALDHDDIVEDASRDTDLIDFAATTNAVISLTLDLSLVTSQAVAPSLSLTLSSATGLENLSGGAGGDTLKGNARGNVIWGREGNDTMDGGSAGYDVLKEERAGNWQLFATTLNLGAEINTFTPGTFDEVSLRGDATGNTLDASSFGGLVRLDGAGGSDTLIGGTGTNYFTGGDGIDTITGGAGLDILAEQRDTNFKLTDTALTIGSETDTISNIDRAELTGGAGSNTLDAATFSGLVMLDGGEGNDVLIGTNQADNLVGGPGDDDLRGGNGNDTYVFDGDEAADVSLGTDTITEVGGGGTDTLDFSSLTTVGVTIDLRDANLQVVNANLTLDLSAPDVIENIVGSRQADALLGNDLANVIQGLEGHDILTGRLGDDTLDGGAGVDANGNLFVDRIVETRDASMTLTNGALTIGAEIDSLAGIEAATLTGGSSGNTLNAAAFTNGSVTLNGEGGNDILSGGSDGDFLTGGAGNDSLTGNAGDDTYLFDTDTNLGADLINETAVGGTDTLDFAATATLGVTVNLANSLVQAVNANLSINLSGASVLENIVGGALNDQLTGNSLDNVLSGLSGNDRLTGADGDDTLAGGDGDDTYVFDADASLYDSTDGDSEGDRIFEDVGSGGTDTLDFSATTTQAISIDLGRGIPQIVNASLRLALTTCHSIENVIGGALGDTLAGNTLDNLIEGRAGDDDLTGSRGNDTYVFDMDSDLGNDDILEDADSEGGTDTIDFSGTSAIGAGTALDDFQLNSTAVQTVSVNLSLQLSSQPSIENVIGTGQNDFITGNALDNVLTGGAGSDVLNGRQGNDTLEGGAGNDTLDGGQGDDTYWFDTDSALGSDTVNEAIDEGRDTLDFSAGSLGVSVNLGTTVLQVINPNLSLTLSGANRIENAIGGTGNDIFVGNALDNVLTGGAGDDIYSIQDGWGADIVLELAAGGSDSLDFSAVTTPLTVTVGSSLLVTSGAQKLTHSGEAVETIRGGLASDTFLVIPSAVTAFTLQGAPGPGDVLNFDAQGLAVTQGSTTLTAAGRQPVTYGGFESVNITNASSITPASFRAGGQRPALSRTNSFDL
jgi:Ca2+-binding RTX toxin-like protein